jgi:hypothetical protein
MHHHWGWTPTALEFGGRKISVVRPRVRQRAGGEVTLPTVRHLQSFDPLSETVLNQILLGRVDPGLRRQCPTAADGNQGSRDEPERREPSARSAHDRTDAGRPVPAPSTESN